MEFVADRLLIDPDLGERSQTPLSEIRRWRVANIGVIWGFDPDERWIEVMWPGIDDEPLGVEP